MKIKAKTNKEFNYLELRETLPCGEFTGCKPRENDLS